MSAQGPGPAHSRHLLPDIPTQQLGWERETTRIELTWENTITEGPNGSGAKEGLPSLRHWLKHLPMAEGLFFEVVVEDEVGT